jgi:nucleotide-binding universal stress UspA family protein
MNILMYYDGTDYTKDAVPFVKKHAKAFNAMVYVVSSLSKGGESELQEINSIQRDFEYLKETFGNEKIPCETHLLIKGHDAGADIVDFANEHGTEEIIIGTEKKTLVEKFLLGSVAQTVILHAKCPVLIV